MNIAGNFIETAGRVPDKQFLVGSTGECYSYSQILSRARRFATVLASGGLGPGDRVILSFPNSVEYLCAYLGALFLDCTLLIVDHRSRPAHLEYVRGNCQADLWVAPGERAD